MNYPKNCSKCGKSMVDDSGSYLIGQSIRVVTEGNWANSDKEFIEKQFGPYPVKDYSFCFECILRSFDMPVE